MSLLSPQDAHYTRLTTKAWLTLGNMITRMKRSDEAWVLVDHGQRFLLRSTTSPNQRKGILWWIKIQYSDRLPQGSVMPGFFNHFEKLVLKVVDHLCLTAVLWFSLVIWSCHSVDKFFLIMASNNSEYFETRISIKCCCMLILPFFALSK